MFGGASTNIHTAWNFYKLQLINLILQVVSLFIKYISTKLVFADMVIYVYEQLLLNVIKSIE